MIEQLEGFTHWWRCRTHLSDVWAVSVLPVKHTSAARETVWSGSQTLKRFSSSSERRCCDGCSINRGRRLNANSLWRPWTSWCKHSQQDRDPLSSERPSQSWTPDRKKLLFWKDKSGWSQDQKNNAVTLFGAACLPVIRSDVQDAPSSEQDHPASQNLTACCIHWTSEVKSQS